MDTVVNSHIASRVVVISLVVLLGACVSKVDCKYRYQEVLAGAADYKRDSRNARLLYDTRVALHKCKRVTSEVYLSVVMSDRGVLGERKLDGNIALLAAQSNDVNKR
jgi:hypothetical protein